MQSLRRHNGFTLIELMLVVAIIAILSATAGPFLLRLAIREDARANSQRIAGLLSQLRARAIDRGVNQIVIFQNPMQFRQAGAPTPVIATIIQDLDGDWTLSAGDIQSPFLAVPKSNPAVTGYGVAGLQPFGPAPLAPEDQGAVTLGLLNLGALVNGTSFPTAAFAPFNGNPAIGFTPQGIPVSLATPATPGSGAGAIYVTDGNKSVYSVVLLPLGGIRVRALQPNPNIALSTWR